MKSSMLRRVYLLSQIYSAIVHVATRNLIALFGGTDRRADFAGSPSGADETDSVPLPAL